MGNIKCVIAAGGLGTRLKDYRNSPTKMLLEVNGTPMINRQISQLQDWGLEDFIIITNPEFETLTKEVTNKEIDFNIIPHQNKNAYDYNQLSHLDIFPTQV